ncbi:hypothetical protein [Yinghuangia seranimata]|uniref:hypothetical protein n=1 Tax=Yinghuangia seranimata TaxID=408067 RepID=UPI00248B7840|nr:hypothetical protein [Yinghuangia seranimata]MDI2129342.1 hypothetical protein [Yinghuangia seranimata]
MSWPPSQAPAPADAAAADAAQAAERKRGDDATVVSNRIIGALTRAQNSDAENVDTSGHSGYWDPGSDSIRNIGAITVGNYQDVNLNRGTAPTQGGR